MLRNSLKEILKESNLTSVVNLVAIDAKIDKKTNFDNEFDTFDNQLIKKV